MRFPSFTALLLAGVAAVGHGWDVARTPPMGYNTWNYWGCRVNATILMDTAKAMVDTGLAAAGYQYVNSDDCWMLADRDAEGRQVANPEKFPDGFAAVATYIHSLNLSSGLYTARGPRTCAGFAASCDHEVQDAAQWASWGIDYVKDDGCSICPNRTDDDDYGIMWQAIQASGRPMILTVEAYPNLTVISQGGYGNAKRVGHDIQALWLSMVSLVDIASGLYIYSHNSTNATYGGWWNDLDMIEVGNSPQFECATGPDALARCQAHFTMWTIMKAPLVLGTNIPAIDAVTLSVLKNAEVIAVNQDPWGIQARRVNVQKPQNNTITASPFDNTLVVKACDASPTQTWHWTNTTTVAVSSPCVSGHSAQSWKVSDGRLVHVESGLCLLENGNVSACPPPLASSEGWVVDSSGLLISSSGCLSAPFLSDAACLEDELTLTPSADIGYRVVMSDGQCVSVAGAGPLGTKDSSGSSWCVANQCGGYHPEGCWSSIPCSEITAARYCAPILNGAVVAGYGNYTLNCGGGSFGWNIQVGASGPQPYSRYLGDLVGPFTINLSNLQGPAGGTIIAADDAIIGDDLVGHITIGGQYCLDVTTGGMLEVWAAPLSGGRYAVALFNRSPGPDTIAVEWSMFNVSSTASFAVRDIWAAADRGTFTGGYKASVNSKAVVYLTLTPA